MRPAISASRGSTTIVLYWWAVEGLGEICRDVKIGLDEGAQMV